MELSEGVLFANRYRLLKEQGRGSFGEVWLAQDEQLDNMQVAIKVYIALDDRGIEEFKKEYKTAYGLNHPNLLHAHHFDVCDKRPYLVMPYCPDSALSLIGNCDVDTLWKLIGDVASGLAYLHSLDIVHHDIKPDNILRTASGDFVITDFGISTKMRSTLRRNSTRAMNQNTSGGSLPYMGPEMFTDSPQSIKATDIWAFGVTLYEIITGDLPFFGQGGVMQMNGAKIPKIECQDEKIVSLVQSCLAKEPWDRPKAGVIETMAKTQPLHPPSPNKPARQHGKTRLWLASLLAIITILSIITLRGRNDPKPIEVEKGKEKIEERALTGMANGHEWVDLGLPSGLKWATCNLGASSPEGFGEYYAYGEISPKDKFTDKNYKFFAGFHRVNDYIEKYTYSKYNDADKKGELDIEDDAARNEWGAGWRMPTADEMRELIDNCTHTFTTMDGVNGVQFVSKNNGKTLFLPQAGDYSGTSIDKRYFHYKSSTLSKGIYGFSYEVGDFINVGGIPREEGGSIRPVIQYDI